MTLFSNTEFQSLATVQSSATAKAGPCVSVYVPTHEAGREVQQDPIRLKNLLSEAKNKLEGSKWAAQSDALLKPANDLLDQENFWRHQQAGLVLFLSAEGMRTYRVPVTVSPLVTVSDRFHTKPLLPLLTDERTFYILAASQNNVALYQATPEQVQAVDLGSTPSSLEVALRYDDPEESIQGHGTGKGGDRTIINGQGSGKDSQNTDILRFFHLVSDGVENVISGENKPLVFVGLDFLFPIYKQANKYPHLSEQAVDVQPDQLSPEEIRDRALEAITPHFSASRKAAAEQYGSLQAQGKATHSLPEIVKAAHDGQIDTLFIAKGNQVWGQFDAENRQVTNQGEQTNNAVDLLDVAASEALMTGATVYIVDPAELPTDAGIEANAAAILRYVTAQTKEPAAVA